MKTCLLLCMCFPGGCAGNKPDLSKGGTPQGILSRLREKEGISAWKEHALVRFAYKVFVPGQAAGIFFPEVAFRLDDYQSLWMSPEAGKRPRSISLAGRPGAVARAALEANSGEESAEELSAPGALLALDFAVRSIRYLFNLPLATSAGSWEFDTILLPEGVSPPLLELFPLEPQAPLKLCLLGELSAEGRISKVIYTSEHPFVSGGTQVVALEDHERTQGVDVAMRRMHWKASGSGLSDRPDPLSQGGANERSWAFREEIRDVVFLGKEEADAYIEREP